MNNKDKQFCWLLFIVAAILAWWWWERKKRARCSAGANAGSMPNLINSCSGFGCNPWSGSGTASGTPNPCDCGGSSGSPVAGVSTPKATLSQGAAVVPAQPNCLSFAGWSLQYGHFGGAGAQGMAAYQAYVASCKAGTLA